MQEYEPYFMFFKGRFAYEQVYRNPYKKPLQ